MPQISSQQPARNNYQKNFLGLLGCLKVFSLP